MCHAGDILQGELEGEVEHPEVVEDGRAISRTDILLAAEGGDGDGVRPEGTGLHAREATINVPLRGRQTTREDVEDLGPWDIRATRPLRPALRLRSLAVSTVASGLLTYRSDPGLSSLCHPGDAGLHVVSMETTPLPRPHSAPTSSSFLSGGGGGSCRFPLL